MSFAQQERDEKIAKVRNLLDDHSADAVLLKRNSSFAWATDGAASYVNTATMEGASSLVITRNAKYIVTSNIEGPRLIKEEGLESQGWEFIISTWDNPTAGLQQLVSNWKLVSDVHFGSAVDCSAKISRLRSRLTMAEIERFRQLGRDCAEAIYSVAKRLQPGMSELEIAGLIGGEAQRRGIQPIVNLVATDQRVYQFRHPLPTDKKLERYALLVLSGRRRGLVCSISRLVHFGKPPDDLRQRIMANAKVSSVFIEHSKPGSALRDILAIAKEAYTRVGFDGEWRHHHQGGVIGYEPREYLATSDSSDVLEIRQALAWNPSISGAKMEDSILVQGDENEIITLTPEWPSDLIQFPGRSKAIPCPLVLEL